MISYRRMLKEYEAEKTLSDAIYAVLRRCIIDGTLPPGSRLQPGDLSKEMNVSRTPVREALRRLEAEEFVTPQSRKGVIVRKLSERELTEIFQIREELEGLAVRLATRNITAIELASLERLLEDMTAAADKDAERLRSLTGQFHLQIAQASHNTRLYQMIKELQDRIRQFGDSTLFLPGQAATALKEHRALVEAIKNRDAAAAEKAARAHRRRTLETRLTMPLRQFV